MDDDESTLAQRNRRILAERGDWPDGALEACERIEAAHPGWWVCWMSANDFPGFERSAGYRADWGDFPEVHLFVADPAALEQQIADSGLTPKR